MRFQPAKFSMKRKILRSYNRAEWFETQKIRVQKKEAKFALWPLSLSVLLLPDCGADGKSTALADWGS